MQCQRKITLKNTTDTAENINMEILIYLLTLNSLQPYYFKASQILRNAGRLLGSRRRYWGEYDKFFQRIQEKKKYSKYTLNFLQNLTF